MQTPKTPAQIQREKDDILAVARAAQRQIENLAAALRQLQAPDVNFHEWMDASTGLGAAQTGIRQVEDIATKWGARG